jgi:hypothetical protein
VLIHEDVLVVSGNTGLTLTSRDPDGLTFTYTGAPPAIDPGTILVGTTDGGFLRRVDDVQLDESTIRVTTTQASLADAITHGDLQLSLKLSEPAEGQAREKSIDQTARVSFGGRTLAISSDVDAHITQGYVDFAPDLDLRMKIRDLAPPRLTELILVIRGDLHLSMDFLLEIERAVAVGRSWNLTPELKYRFGFLAGVFPVEGYVGLRFEIGGEVQTEAAGSLETGGDATISIEAGVVYRDGRWEEVWNASSTFEGHEAVWVVDGSVDGRVFIRPRLSLAFYEVVGPFVALKGYFGGQYLPIPNRELCTYVGISGEVGGSFEVFDHTLAEISFELFDRRWSLDCNILTRYTLTTTVVGNGSVILEPPGGLYVKGSIVQATAVPNNGWQFVRWEMDASGAANPITVTIDRNNTIRAVFGADLTSLYTLTVTIVPPTGGTVTKIPNKEAYNLGEVVALTAIPSSGFSFGHWSGDVTGRGTFVTLTVNRNKSVVATFQDTGATTYTLTVNIEGEGAVILNPPGGIYDAGTIVELTAEPTSGWMFDRWEADVSGTNPLTNVTIDGDKDVLAIFREGDAERYTVTVTIQGQGSVALDPPGNEYDAGTIVTLTAEPASGWCFERWELPVDSTSNPVEVTMDSDKTLRVVFSYNLSPVAEAGSFQFVTDDPDNDGLAEVQFDGSGSYDSDGAIASYVWTLRGREIGVGIVPLITLSDGNHVVHLTVTDNCGRSAMDTVGITILLHDRFAHWVWRSFELFTDFESLVNNALGVGDGVVAPIVASEDVWQFQFQDGLVQAGHVLVYHFEPSEEGCSGEVWAANGWAITTGSIIIPPAQPLVRRVVVPSWSGSWDMLWPRYLGAVKIYSGVAHLDYVEVE